MSNPDDKDTLKIIVQFFPSKEKKVISLTGSPNGIGLLKTLGMHIDSHILVKNDTPIPIDEKLSDGDEIRILSVTSGG